MSSFTMKSKASKPQSPLKERGRSIVRHSLLSSQESIMEVLFYTLLGQFRGHVIF
jgi:hypothetical protein